MICPKCQFEQDTGLSECLHCGIIFAKFRQKADSTATGSTKTVPVDIDSAADRRETMKQLFFPVVEDPNELITAGKGLLMLLLAYWSLSLFFASIESNKVGQSFLHLVNLPFHEAGHIIFSPLGRFIQVLGGTLGQLLMPAICCGVLLLRTRDAFGAAVALWWLGESFMDIAPYINDARALDLMLLGGVTGKDVADYHDWEFLLGRLGLSHWDHGLAYLANGTGIVLMSVALLWATVNMWPEIKVLRSSR